MPRKSPTVSIVVPAYNEAESIERCIDACIDQTRPALEILVVNNMSNDDTDAIVRRVREKYQDKSTSIRLLNQSESQGITPTRNYGFDRAQGDVIGRIDADSIPDRDWVQQLQRIFRSSDVDAVTGPVIYHDMPARRFGRLADDQIRNMLDKMSREYKFLFGSNMGIRKRVWHEIKPELCDDPDNLMHEDVDLAVHLTQLGYKTIYDSRLSSGVSARRLENNPKQFYSYIMRNERTFKEHDLKSRAARVPIIIYLSTYFPLRTVRLAYDNETNRLSLATFRQRLAESRQIEDEPETEKSLLAK